MDSLDYIDAYFQGGFSPEEIGRFEEKIKEDPAFAADVAYYIGARGILKEAREDERMTRFTAIYRQAVLPEKAVPVRGLKRAPVLAAAVLLIVAALCWLLFRVHPDAQRVANQWIAGNLSHLPVKLSGADSMQTGLGLYNNGKYPEALQQFERIFRADTLNSTALLDAGIVSLRMGNYDQALDHFKKLETHTDPHVNPALFYQALTLLKRNRDKDADLAKQLLRKIVQEDLAKRKDAEELLGKL